MWQKVITRKGWFMALDPISIGLEFVGKIADKIWPDPTAKAQGLLELEKLKQSGELAQLAADTELFKAEVQDRDSARKRESDIAVAEKAPLINKIVTPILALTVVFMTFALFCFVVLEPNSIEQGKKELVMFILGSLTSISGIVLNYYFGTSSSSQQKNSVIASLSK